jgi:hypothetical protein
MEIVGTKVKMYTLIDAWNRWDSFIHIIFNFMLITLFINHNINIVLIQIEK